MAAAVEKAAMAAAVDSRKRIFPLPAEKTSLYVSVAVAVEVTMLVVITVDLVKEEAEADIALYCARQHFLFKLVLVEAAAVAKEDFLNMEEQEEQAAE